MSVWSLLDHRHTTHSVTWTLPALVPLLVLPVLVVRAAPAALLNRVVQLALAVPQIPVDRQVLVDPQTPEVRNFGPWPFSYRYLRWLL